MSVKLNMARPTTDSRTPRQSPSARLPQPSASNRRGLARRLLGQRGTALMETALTLPLLLLVSVGIFEFGRAYQTWQILTNAAREGARVAVLPNATVADVKSRVKAYVEGGQLIYCGDACVAVNQAADIDIGPTKAKASIVTISYPFNFMVLNPVAQLVVKGSTLGGAALTLTASAEMRNEVQ